MTLEERFNKLKATPSSINEHLDVLRDYAARSESVAEFGVDIGQSTTAFLMGQPKVLYSVDVVRRPELSELTALSKYAGGLAGYIELYRIGATCWTLHIIDSREYVMPEVDMLFIDSAHSYDQIRAELERHHAQVRKYILAHDYITFGEWGEAGEPQVGVMPALEEFLAAHPEWVERERIPRNNGLFIMERVSD